MQRTGAQTQNGSAAWWPSEFGPDDQIGMLNHITAAKRVEALSLVRSGRLYDLAHVLDSGCRCSPAGTSNRRSSPRLITRTGVGSVTTA